MLSYYRSNCYCINNCFQLFFYKMHFNCFEWVMSTSTSDRWWFVTYSFPIYFAESSPVLSRYPIPNFLFFWTGSCFALPKDGGVFALDRALHSRAWWLLLPHFIYLPSIFRLSHTSLGTNLPFFFSLPASPPLNCILSSRPRFFLWPLLLLPCSFF